MNKREKIGRKELLEFLENQKKLVVKAKEMNKKRGYERISVMKLISRAMTILIFFHEEGVVRHKEYFELMGEITDKW